MKESSVQELAPAVGLSAAAHQTQAMRRLVAVVQELSLARTLDRVQTIVRTAARELTGADGATFVLRDGEQCHYADEDAISPLWKGQRFPLRACVSGWAMLHRQPAVVEDIYADARIPVDAYRPTFVKSLVMVPIRTEAPIGAIGNYWARRHRATGGEIELLQALANTTAVALENVQLYAELEQRVRDRTEQLQLANRELEAFSYSVSHDLRAPLRHIDGYAGMLERHLGGALDEKGRRLLTTVAEAARRMGVLIDDLLAFSRMGRVELLHETVDLQSLVQEVIREQETGVNGGRVVWQCGPLPTVNGDRAMLRLVWVNLLANALKYSRPRDPARIEIGSQAPPGEVILHVRDNGVGFDPAHAHKLFGVFQRLHPTTQFEGTGVGLANVRRIVARHGGRTWAEGRPEEGATFYFSLPCPAPA